MQPCMPEALCTKKSAHACYTASKLCNAGACLCSQAVYDAINKIIGNVHHVTLHVEKQELVMRRWQ